MRLSPKRFHMCSSVWAALASCVENLSREFKSTGVNGGHCALAGLWEVGGASLLSCGFNEKNSFLKIHCWTTNNKLEF